jgi:hypothetical protein
MSIHTKFLVGKNGIVFIGLNATEEAVKVGSVFCTRVHFWKILKEAGLIKAFSSKIEENKYPYEHMAIEVFISGTLSNHSRGLGFTDMIDDDTITSKKSNQVKVLSEHLESLKIRLKQANPDKIVLMGKRVTEEFLKMDKTLKPIWNSRKTADNETAYNYLGDTYFLGSKMKVFVVPFPETSPVADKHTYYEIILRH